MRHVLVHRTVLALAALLVAASALFAWAAGRPRAAGPSGQGMGAAGAGAGAAPLADGAALFEQHCAACHAARELADPLRQAPDAAAASEALAAFLRRHGEASDAEDRAIVEFLAAGGGR